MKRVALQAHMETHQHWHAKIARLHALLVQNHNQIVLHVNYLISIMTIYVLLLALMECIPVDKIV
jgi:hypothetical protein